MKGLLKLLPAFGLVLALFAGGAPASAQQQAPQPTAAGIAAAKEILQLKNAGAMYAQAVPNVVQRTKDQLLQTNINYQKDLNEVAVIVAQKLAGKQNEIGDAMAKIYATLFTEQELKDLVTFYKSPLGQKLLTTEPKAIQTSMGFMEQWAQAFSEAVNAEFRAEMRKRGKEI